MKGIRSNTAGTKPKKPNREIYFGPKRRVNQRSLPLLQQIDPKATARLWAKHKLVPSLSQYLTHIRHANIVGALAVDRLGFKAARAHIKDWDNTQHSTLTRKAFADLLGLPEPYLAGLDNGWEYGKVEWVREEARRLGLEDGVAVRHLVWPDEAQE